MILPAGAVALVLLAAALGYLLGAIPTGLIVGRVARGIDLRQHGSGRTGTTNALRTLGPAAAVTVLVLDLAKGVGAVLLGRLLGAGGGEPGEWIAAAAGVGAVLGHVLSVFLGFRGGRGVATTAGALLALAPLALAIVAPPVLAIMWLSRFVSLGSMIGAVAAPVVVGVLVAVDRAGVPALAYALASSSVVLVAHRDNLARLRAGTERRIGQREEVRGDA